MLDAVKTFIEFQSTMKILLLLLLLGATTISCSTKGNGENRGKRRPCNGWNNIEICECSNGDTYNNKKDLKEFCGNRNGNPMKICLCSDGKEWTKPVKKNKPCLDRRNIDSCICKDGKTYEGKRAVRRNCKTGNLVVKCRCKDGIFWSSKKNIPKIIDDTIIDAVTFT